MVTIGSFRSFAFPGLVVGGLLGLAAIRAAEPIRLSGAAALYAALHGQTAALEKAVGSPVALTSKNAGKGLQDLCAGRCDVAMVTGSLEKAAAGANAETAGSVDLAALKAIEVGKDPILFVVHPSNPVASLTLDQVKKILTGAVTNWKEVGGNDAKILVFTLGARNGPRIAVDLQVLEGAAMAATAVMRETPKDICPIVAQKAEGFGFLGESNKGPGVKVLKVDREIAMPFLLVTRGDPTPAQAKLIAAAKVCLQQ